jgi:hypothetical protein
MQVLTLRIFVMTLFACSLAGCCSNKRDPSVQTVRVWVQDELPPMITKEAASI